MKVSVKTATSGNNTPLCTLKIHLKKENILGSGAWNKGMKMLEKYPNWGMTGKKQSQLWKDKFDRTGQKASPKTIEKLRESHLKIPHSGKQSLKQRIRGGWEYNNWRKLILKRDRKCLKCDSIERLQVDHINAFAVLLDEFLKQYSQFSPIEDKETLVRLAISWNKFWDISNGRTLCWKCHLNR